MAHGSRGGIVLPIHIILWAVVGPFFLSRSHRLHYPVATALALAAALLAFARLAGCGGASPNIGGWKDPPLGAVGGLGRGRGASAARSYS